MKKIYLSLYSLFLTVFLTAQSFTQSPWQSIYLGNSTRNTSTTFINKMADYSSGKQFLLENMPGLWTPAYRQQFGAFGIYYPINGQVQTNFQSVYNSLLTIDVAASQLGESEYSIRSNRRLGNFRLNALLNGHFYNKNHDNNEDGFRDLDHKNRLFFLTSLHYDKTRNQRKFTSITSLYYMRLVQEGGELNFDKNIDSLSNIYYGNGHTVQNGGFSSDNRIEFLKNKKIKQDINIHVDGQWHKQNSYFGKTNYTINESVFNGFLAYNQKRALSNFSIAAYGKQINLTDSFVTDYQLNKIGVYGHLNWQIRKWLNWKTFLKQEYANDTWNFLPAMKVQFNHNKSKYQRIKSISLYGGRENRIARFTAEYLPFMNNHHGLAYNNLSGPHQEFAWYAGGSAQIEKFKLFSNFHINKIQVAWNSTFYDSQVLPYKDGEQFTLGLSENTLSHTLESSIAMNLYRFHLQLAHRFRLNEYTINNISSTQQWLSPKHTFASQFKYRNNRMDLNLAYYFQSEQLFANGNYSPNNHRLDFTGSYSFSNNNFASFLNPFTVFGGLQNITDYKQTDLVQGTPFSSDFDATQVWGNAVGFRIFSGIRYNFD